MKHTDAEIATAVKQSKSYVGVLRKLGLRPAGGSHFHYSQRIRRLKLDTSHFTGKGWNRGGISSKRLRPEEILVYHRIPGYREDVHRLVRALKAIGRPWKCVRCGSGTRWRGESLTLQIHHSNGDCMDNRAENLDVCCPNCHQQLDRLTNRHLRK